MVRARETPVTDQARLPIMPRRYGVIYADPPWSFRSWSTRGTGRSAVSHYDCLGFADLAGLSVTDLAADDCVLFLWATDPLLPRALDLIAAWGFEYKTVGFYWVKLNAAAKHDADYFTGMGFWTRANAELCLLATRGKPVRKAKDVRRLVVEPRREHSRKPDCVRDRIVRLVGGPYLELFSRETKPGWDCWGDQVGLFDHGAVRTRRQPSRLAAAPLLPLGRLKADDNGENGGVIASAPIGPRCLGEADKQSPR
jgi:N6-adenosine-specific RNA methylase IME4